MLINYEPITLILPLGLFSYFAKACIQNIAETCGVPMKYLDVIVLTSNNIPITLTQTLKDMQKEWDFRIVTVPFDVYGDHLKYIDWCLRNANVRDWIILQHADYFWVETGWVHKINQAIQSHDKLFALAPYGHTHFHLNGEPMINLHDYFGVYNKKMILDHDWSFQWGRLRNLTLSPELTEQIKSKKIQWKNEKRAAKNREVIDTSISIEKDWVDGSELITLEAAAHFPDLVQKIKIKHEHLWEVFRTSYECVISGNKLTIPFPKHVFIHKIHFFMLYSWFSSFRLDLEEIKNNALPWVVMKLLCEQLNIKPDKLNQCKKQLENFFSRYKYHNDVIGESDTFGIEIVELNDIRYTISTSTSSRTPSSTIQPTPSISSVAAKEDVFKNL